MSLNDHQDRARPLLIIEPWDLGMKHVEVNAAFIHACARAFPGRDLHFCASQPHLDEVGPRLSDGGNIGVSFEALPQAVGDHGISWPLHLHLLRYLSATIRRLRPAVILFTSMQTYRLHVVIKLLAHVHPKIKFGLVCHWALLLGIPQDQRGFSHMLQKAFTAWRPANIRYIALAPHVVDYCRRSASHVATAMRWMHLPYFSPDSDITFRALTAPIRFGFIGFAYKEKGTQIFFDIARDIRHGELASRAAFIHLGSNGMGQGLPAKNSVESIGTGEEMISREAFNRAMAGIHYCVFPYPPERYADRASGALFDAFAWAKPVIALRSPLFEQYFNLLGDIGYLCDTKEELQATIENITKNPPVRKYREQVMNLQAVERTMGISVAAHQLTAIF